LDSCCQYITSQAKKQAKNGCAAIEDAVVYGWAVHYYQEDSVVIEKTNVKKVVAKKETTTPKEVKPIKALVSDKKNKGKCVEMDLFAGMF
jgi:regulatory protein YycH of two-component signal transduction system YycFG